MFLMLLIGCNKTNKYHLDVDDPDNYILEELDKKYYSGEKITVKASIIHDVDLNLYLDNKFECSQTVIEENGNYTHWEFYFTMPAHNTKISFKTAKEKEQTITRDNIIYFDNVVSEIVYNIKFDYEETDDTLKLHEEFAKNSGLVDLDYKNIFYFKNSVYIFIYFSPEKDTTEVQKFMNKLKEDNKSIMSIDKIVYYKYSSVYIHDPSFYKLEDNQKVPFELTRPFIFSKGIYRNVEDIQNAIDVYFHENSSKLYIMERKEKVIESIKSIYNEKYFEKNILIVTDTITTGSGSNRQELNSIYLKDNTLYIFVKMYFASIGTCDMQYTKFGITIDKNDINDIDNLSQKLLYNNRKYNGHGLW